MADHRQPRKLNVPHGTTLNMLVGQQPDEPLPDIAGFANLSKTHSKRQIEELNEWITPQHTIDMIIKHHGTKGLNTVLKGIAIASSAKAVHMTSRIASIAGFYGYEIH